MILIVLIILCRRCGSLLWTFDFVSLLFYMTACGTRCTFIYISTNYTYNIQQSLFIHIHYVYFDNSLYLDLNEGSAADTVWLQPHLFARSPHCCQNRKEKYFLNLIINHIMISICIRYVYVCPCNKNGWIIYSFGKVLNRETTNKTTA